MFESKINPLWQSFIPAVQEEVKPALGCTEPISLALAAAAAAAELDGTVERIDAWVSPNLMKNGMGVTVPGTGMVGLPIAAALGALGGDAKAGLEVLKDASAKAVADAKAMLAAGHVAVMLQEPCNDILFSRAKVYSGDSWACVTIVGDHTNIVRIETDKGVVFTQPIMRRKKKNLAAGSAVSYLAGRDPGVCECGAFDAIRFILDAAGLNGALSQEGLRGSGAAYRFDAGQTVRSRSAGERSLHGDFDPYQRGVRRQNGRRHVARDEQLRLWQPGITATVPVMVVAEHVGADDERLARALMLSHLSAIYIHHQLPRLSALCAATTAAMGAAAGMAWLIDGRYDTIAMAISSMIGDVSGMICDGASNSCAMKVSTSASAAWKAVLMALDDTAVTGNEGIVAHNVEQSIANLCSLACRSMQQTDKQIIEIMASKAH